MTSSPELLVVLDSFEGDEVFEIMYFRAQNNWRPALLYVFPANILPTRLKPFSAFVIFAASILSQAAIRKHRVR